LQEDSIHHLRSELGKIIDELWKLITQHSNKLNGRQMKEGRLARRMEQEKVKVNCKLRWKSLS